MHNVFVCMICRRVILVAVYHCASQITYIMNHLMWCETIWRQTRQLKYSIPERTCNGVCGYIAHKIMFDYHIEHVNSSNIYCVPSLGYFLCSIIRSYWLQPCFRDLGPTVNCRLVCNVLNTWYTEESLQDDGIIFNLCPCIKCIQTINYLWLIVTIIGIVYCKGAKYHVYLSMLSIN